MAKKRANVSIPKSTLPGEDAGADSSFTPQEISAIRRDGLLATAFFSMVFIVGIYVYASYGGPWVDSLDERIGEIVAARARGLAHAERREEAVVKFQEALEAQFDDPMQRVWTSHDLAKLLLELERYDEAIDVAKTSTSLNRETGEAFGIWHKALEEKLQEDEALQLTKTWFAWGVENNSASSTAWAKFYEGLHLRKAGLDAQALEAFKEGLRHQSKGEIGQLLSQSVAQLRQAQAP